MRAGAGGGGKAVRARFAARSCPAHPISSSERYWLSLTRHLRRTIAVQSTRIGRRAPRPRAMSSRYLICFPPLFPSLFTSLFPSLVSLLDSIPLSFVTPPCFLPLFPFLGSLLGSLLASFLGPLFPSLVSFLVYLFVSLPCFLT